MPYRTPASPSLRPRPPAGALDALVLAVIGVALIALATSWALDAAAPRPSITRARQASWSRYVVRSGARPDPRALGWWTVGR